MGIENPVNLGNGNRDRLVRYLLGDLPEPDRKRVESECLADDQLSEALREAENDLLDSYACGELSDKQRLQFEQNFLDSPEKQEHVEFATLLMNPAVRERVAITAIQNRRRSWWQSFMSSLGAINLPLKVATVASGMVIVALATFLIFQNQRLRTELSRLQSEQSALHQQIAELQQAVQATTVGEKNQGDGSGGKRPPHVVIVSALLKPGLPRQGGSGSGNRPLAIPPATSSVMLLLDLRSDQYSRYSVVLETVEGKIVRRIHGLRSQSARAGRIIEVHLPPQSLPKGDYVLTLSGEEPNSAPQVVDSYIFSVSR